MKPIDHEFTIERKRWVRGGARKGRSKLLNEEGNMCCLGFYEKSLGVTAEELQGMRTPGELMGAHRDVFDFTVEQPDAWLFELYSTKNSDACRCLMNANDKPAPAATRERNIARQFRVQGVKVTFK